MGAISGKYKIKKPEKYKGNIKQIIYRSLLERRFMIFLESSEDVLFWNSEEVVVPYFFPVTGKNHRYFMDFWVKLKNGSQFLVEIKPLTQTKPPKEPKKNHWKTKRRYTESQITFLRNQCKWKTAKVFAEKHGMEFKVLTDADLKRCTGSKEMLLEELNKNNLQNYLI